MSKDTEAARLESIIRAAEEAVKNAGQKPEEFSGDVDHWLTSVADASVKSSIRTDVAHNVNPVRVLGYERGKVVAEAVRRGTAS